MMSMMTGTQVKDLALTLVGHPVGALIISRNKASMFFSQKKLYNTIQNKKLNICARINTIRQASYMIYMYLLEQHLALLISIDNHLCDHAQGLHHNDFIQPRVRFHLHQLRVNISAFTTQQNTLHLNIREQVQERIKN